jgi:hypothetical protein
VFTKINYKIVSVTNWNKYLHCGSSGTEQYVYKYGRKWRQWKIMNKNTTTSGKLIKAVFASYVYVYSFCTVRQFGYSIIPYLLDYEIGVWGEMSENVVSNSVDEKGDGLDI